MDGVVSTDWLARNYESTSVLIIDIRDATDYAIGHIPRAINIPWAMPECTWISYGPDDLLLQLPKDSYLFGNLSAAGVSKYKRIVVSMANASPPYPQAQAARVAMTLKLAGVPQVQVLNGGFTTWSAEGRPMSTDVPTLTPSSVKGQIDRSDLVNREYVRGAINKKIILDARDPGVYNGSVIEEYAPKAGHIPSAKSLPTVTLFDANGNFKDKEALANLVKSVAGAKVTKQTEIITYCGVGGYAAALYWILTAELGYCNVKFYDGSAQDWVKYYDMEI
ncbi:Rhodanese-like protein [Trematosphaeria pertusa]|uniref:Rhodanese-like protein n=1 Tax=Trematosphaeria pertusa TaxID=390896 RepID=A0A6A6INJ8_9PLEO|nr:Rhodanese-like protein [Trematosphaeria pertusa]KAF2251668.1 Rhodanese-like protein [Trematosphaeria pertusa]